MLELTKNERTAIIFLLALLLAGMSVSLYQKTRPCVDLSISSSETGMLEETIRTKGKVDINIADAGELEMLPGVGTTLAGRIVEYRRAKGGFGSIDELKDVKGIGEKLFDKIKDRVSLGQ